MSYYRGNFYKERSDKRGWLVGQFMEKKSGRHTDDVEIKFWKFAKGEDAKHVAKYLKTAVECGFILKGKITGIIGSEKVVLEAGEYVVIPPGVVSNYPIEILEDVEGLTVKAPSVYGDKVEV